MKKNSSLILIYLLFSISISFSQNENLPALLIPNELKEDANAVLRNQSIKITIEEVDKMVVYKKETVTVLNELGNVDAKIAEGYDNDTKITKLSATIYDAFGNEIKKHKERDFLDVSAVDGGTLYSDARVKYVNYTPVSYPYTLVFESEYKTSSTGFVPGWFPVNGYHISVEKANYTIDNPNKIPWKQKETNFEDFSIKKQISDSQISYKIENQPALKYENNSVSYRQILPIAKIALNKFALKEVKGSASNWKEFGKWRYEFLKNGTENPTELMKHKMLDLVKGVDNPIEKAKIIYKYVQNKTRYISVQEGIGGWEPIAASQVDKVGYGDCKGLTNYTKVLLDAVGVKSYYSVIWAGKDKRDVEKDFFSMQGNHVILNIPNGKQDIWLECTSQTIPFGFLGDFTDDRNVLVITPEGGVIKKTTSYKDSVNLQTTKGIVTLDENGNLNSTFKRISKGLQYDDKSVLDGYTEEELIKQYKSDVWGYNNNLKIESVAINNNKDSIVFTEKIKASIANYATINNQEYLFRVNVFNKETFVPKRYRDRKLPLKIDRGYKDVDEFEIKIPEGYILPNLPENKELTTKFGTYKVYFKKINEATFSYHKSIEIKEGVHPKEDYKLYRNFRKSIAKNENLRIALQKK